MQSIVCALVGLFGLYLSCKIMFPQNRFERNTHLAIFHLAAFLFILMCVVPHEKSSIDVAGFLGQGEHGHKHQPKSVVEVFAEVFRLALLLVHTSSLGNLFLLTLHRRYKDNEKVQRYAALGRTVNTVLAYTCLAFLIPFRHDFDAYFATPVPYALGALLLLASQPDSKLEILLNILVLVLAYFQITLAFILAVFLLNFKVFHFGFKKTKYIKTSQDPSIAWAKTEFQDATSYLNSTIECTTDNIEQITERQLKRAIRSYGIISIKEEKIEYIGTSSSASFVLFDESQDAGQPKDAPGDKEEYGPPRIENSQLDKGKQGKDAKDPFGDIPPVSPGRDRRQGRRSAATKHTEKSGGRDASPQARAQNGRALNGRAQHQTYLQTPDEKPVSALMQAAGAPRYFDSAATGAPESHAMAGYSSHASSQQQPGHAPPPAHQLHQQPYQGGYSLGAGRAIAEAGPSQLMMGGAGSYEATSPAGASRAPQN